jgi:uncharacterized protein (TIGR03643 family)
MRKYDFTPEQVEQIILMAWGDTISFETITREWGLTENEVVAFMRRHQSPRTYIRWRKRVERRRGSSSKHEQISAISSRRQKFPV